MINLLECMFLVTAHCYIVGEGAKFKKYDLRIGRSYNILFCLRLVKKIVGGGGGVGELWLATAPLVPLSMC